MKAGTSKRKQAIELPGRIISRRDVLETARELGELRDNLVAASVKGSKVTVQEPTQRVKALMEQNGVKKLTADSAERLEHGLQRLADRAPMLRFTFAGEPPIDFMKELIAWVRSNVHASALVVYTVQPQIAGGYILTTDTRRHDASWRSKLGQNPLALGLALDNATKGQEGAA